MNFMDTTAAGILSIVLGLVLVFVGRRLFWVFVAAVGFIAGLRFAPELASDQPQWIIVTIGVVLGIVGALLAMLLQRVAVAVAGWFAGGFLATRLASGFGLTDETMVAVAFVAGAILAAIVFSLLFDWTLIALTAVSGALMVCDALQLAPAAEWLIGAVLVGAGLLVQASTLVKPEPMEPHPEPEPGARTERR